MRSGLATDSWLRQGRRSARKRVAGADPAHPRRLLDPCEQVFARTFAEVPHALFVEVLDLEPRAAGLWARATIWVERPSQVGIVVGRGGAGIAAIRRGAEAELGAIFGRRVTVNLRVKVRKKWRRDDAVLHGLRGRG